jgi:hypothetical protein
MQEISGVLTMLGSGTVVNNSIGKSFVTYDSIEIGDHLLQKLRSARSLQDFLSRGLGQHVTLYLAGKSIVGICLPGGKIYYWSRSSVTLLVVALMGLGFGAMIFGGVAAFSTSMAGVAVLAWWGYLYLMFGTELKHILTVQPVLKKLGGIPLKS